MNKYDKLKKQIRLLETASDNINKLIRSIVNLEEDLPNWRSLNDANWELWIQTCRLKEQLPCEDFLEAYGFEMYEAFKAKYPISYKTQVQWLGHTYLPAWTYVLHSDSNAGWASDPQKPTSRLNIQTGQCTLEQWIDGAGSLRGRFGYAPEIDTIFVASPKPSHL